VSTSHRQLGMEGLPCFGWLVMLPSMT